jgi:hypothetical protein
VPRHASFLAIASSLADAVERVDATALDQSSDSLALRCDRDSGCTSGGRNDHNRRGGVGPAKSEEEAFPSELALFVALLAVPHGPAKCSLCLQRGR